MLKVCGLHGDGADEDITLLSRIGVDLVGLWHGVPAGEAELPRNELERLAGLVRATGTVESVLVTLEHDPASIADTLDRAGIRWVQLHAYQPPSMVQRLKAMLPGDVTIVKALHINGSRCVEAKLIRSYERAGVDVFLIDAATDDRVGSTGRSVPPDVAATVAGELDRPFLLAGGITARSRPRYGALVRQEGFRGVDVCTAAWDRAGRLNATDVAAIHESWSDSRSPRRYVR